MRSTVTRVCGNSRCRNAAISSRVTAFTSTSGSVDGGQLGDRQRQPLGAVPAEVDLGAGVGARALQRQQHALAELGVEHALADAQAAMLLGDLLLHAGGHRRLDPGSTLAAVRHPAGAHHALQATAALPGLLVLTGKARAEALVARCQPFQALLGQLVEEAALDVIAGLAVQHARLAETERQLLSRPRDRHIHQPALLLQAVVVGHRVLVREQAFFQARDEDRIELQALGRVHRHKLHRVLPGLGLVVAGLQ
mmetsp:Transcript_37598/g.68057  ORF Transcript_37598/g.68057 Transcript_37598/m.68057 type:complete len:252 (-) Transcript_37598:251-1006(-)